MQAARFHRTNQQDKVAVVVQIPIAASENGKRTGEAFDLWSAASSTNMPRPRYDAGNKYSLPVVPDELEPTSMSGEAMCKEMMLPILVKLEVFT